MDKICLSIAGFDGSGGAGIQADLKTFSALDCYGMNVLTALPIQNTCGVKNCYDLPLKAIEEQLHAIFDDIKPTSIKIGMLFSAEIVKLVADFLTKYAKDIPIILDPVMVAKSGDSLLLPNAVDALKKLLLPISDIVTPNLLETRELIGYNEEDSYIMAEKILEFGSASVLVKGGHNIGATSDDLFMEQSQNAKWLKSGRIESKNTHGTGCTLSAAICAFIAHGFSKYQSCVYAKKYIYGAIQAAKNNSPGLGHGSVHHFHHIWPCINKIIKE
jgi:hydroxymethylpyrimidine/phosphomethylpyrimidine kinase